MKTKILALLLVVVLLVICLASCTTPEPPACTKHVDNNNDKKCDICQKPMEVDPTPGPGDNPEVDETPDVTWNETVSLLYCLTENSNGGELSSGCRHYMAGDTSKVENAGNTFYTTIQERNAYAEEYAKVLITYDYTSITSGWGGNIKAITALGTQTSDNGRPDIIVNFVYDMMSASLNKAFKNVYSQKNTSSMVKPGELSNYFAFATEGAYNPEYLDKDNGYMVEYMQSLSLSRDRMYFVASDYFIDLVRAFFVVPVNINMLEAINPNESHNPFITDADKADGKYTIDEFYAMVNDGKWTYDAVAAFAADVYSPGDTDDPLDGTLGFAVSTDGGLGASGLLYTTSITIIERQWDEQYIQNDDGTYTGDFIYWYPDENSENAKNLRNFVANLGLLFGAENPGVRAVGNKGAVNGTSFANGDSLAAILQRFAEDQLLFGGIICVGSLEDSGYKTMVANGGSFGVVPVPLYRGEYYDEELGAMTTDKYLTQVHSLGKVAGLTFTSKKFAAASAYLNWLSLNSSDILDDYYQYTLTNEAAGGAENEGTADMLAYIRAHVRTSFDKAFEDAIAKHYAQGEDTWYNSNKWHNLILHANFELDPDTIASSYKSIYTQKQGALDTIENSYANLPF